MSLQIFYNRKSVIYTHIVLANGAGERRGAAAGVEVAAGVGAGAGDVDEWSRAGWGSCWVSLLVNMNECCLHVACQFHHLPPPLSLALPLQRKSLWIDYNFIYDYSFYLLLSAVAVAGSARECCNPAATISMALNLFWAEHKVTFPRQFYYGEQLNWYWHCAYCANNAQCHAPRLSRLPCNSKRF